MKTTAPDNLLPLEAMAGYATHEHVGHTTVGRTVYQIFRLPLGENTRRAGIRGQYALVGANGAQYLVTDHGPRYRLGSIACGGSKHQRWTPAPRPLRGLERSHLSLILDTIQETRP